MIGWFGWAEKDLLIDPHSLHGLKEISLYPEQVEENQVVQEQEYALELHSFPSFFKCRDQNAQLNWSELVFGRIIAFQ